jgi:hypothetical protein
MNPPLVVVEVNYGKRLSPQVFGKYSKFDLGRLSVEELVSSYSQNISAFQSGREVLQSTDEGFYEVEDTTKPISNNTHDALRATCMQAMVQSTPPVFRSNHPALKVSCTSPSTSPSLATKTPSVLTSYLLFFPLLKSPRSTV